jgi:hypothetical protein
VESSERERIAIGYIEYVEAISRRDSADLLVPDDAERAHSKLQRVVREGPAQLAWTLVSEVLRRVPDEQLDAYAAGLLEDLVRRWGTELVGVIEDEAERNERFRWALGCIWLLVDDLPSNVLARIVKASDDEIEPFNDYGVTRLFNRGT